MKTVARKQRRLSRQAGQGMAEYIIIVALVAVAGLATWELVGSSIGQSAAGVASAIAGTDASDIRDEAQTTAEQASSGVWHQCTWPPEASTRASYSCR